MGCTPRGGDGPPNSPGPDVLYPPFLQHGLACQGLHPSPASEVALRHLAQQPTKLRVVDFAHGGFQRLEIREAHVEDVVLDKCFDDWAVEVEMPEASLQLLRLCVVARKAKERQ